MENEEKHIGVYYPFTGTQKEYGTLANLWHGCEIIQLKKKRG